MIKSRPVNDAGVRSVLDRFVAETHRRCEWYGVPGQRRERRFHRTWPLSVAYAFDGESVQVGVALYNASSTGLAFLGPHAISHGEIVRIRLFWHDDDCPWVNAVVHHCTRRNDVYLVGCEFVAIASGAA